ncbi:MAG: rhodanese-like domain-containing protein [bacterium]
MQSITVQELKSVLDQGKREDILVLDVRTPAEHRGERILGVTNIPVQEIGKHLDELKKYKQVYVHCASGNRSGSACVQMAQYGLPNAINVSGGITEWKKEGFPVLSSGKQVIPVMRQVQIIAGSLVLLGVILSLVIHPGFIYLSGFVGAGLLFAGLSGFCTMAVVLEKMPWNR